MNASFLSLADPARHAHATKTVGEVASISGLCLVARGLERTGGMGQRCRVVSKNRSVLAEITGISHNGIQLLPYGTWDGIAVGDAVELLPDKEGIFPDMSWVGAVLDAHGNLLSTVPRFRRGTSKVNLRRTPPPAFARKRVGEKLATGVKCVDVFTPICRGQRMGIFAGSGVGKSTLLSMLARHAEADVIVIALIGERGREVREFIQDDLGPEGMAKSVIVVATGDEPPLQRRQAAWTAMAIAEYFRDTGLQVLFLMDSVTRFCMAQREIGLANGEPPTTKSYPPTVFSELPMLLERSGPGREGEGDITGIFTVLVDGDDFNEPIADAVRGIVDGHIVLDRRIAERNRFPAINIHQSISRMLPNCHTPSEWEILHAARRAFARYDDVEDLVRIGAYRKGTDPSTDAAIQFYTEADAYLGQSKDEHVSPCEAFAEIFRMLVDANIEVAVEPDAEGRV